MMERNRKQEGKTKTMGTNEDKTRLGQDSRTKMFSSTDPEPEHMVNKTLQSHPIIQFNDNTNKYNTRDKRRYI
jgi:hypothetical protein